MKWRLEEEMPLFSEVILQPDMWESHSSFPGSSWTPPASASLLQTKTIGSQVLGNHGTFSPLLGMTHLLVFQSDIFGSTPWSLMVVSLAFTVLLIQWLYKPLIHILNFSYLDNIEWFLFSDPVPAYIEI